MAGQDAEFDEELYSLLNTVLDNYLSKKRTAQIEQHAQALVERGYFFRDAAGSLRLSERGKAVLREGARRR
jgi:hypothetical protein